jgi:two-component system, LytTR family, sensor kinase
MKFSPQTNNLLYALLHLMGLIILFILPLYLINFEIGKNSLFVEGWLLQNTVYVIMFYLNYSLFIPKLLFNNKIIAYTIVVLLIMISASFIIETWYHYLFEKMNADGTLKQALQIMEKNKNFPKGPPMRFHIYTHLITGLMVTGFSLGLRVSGRLIKNEKEKKELEKERLNSELAFLKNQVSPHFFFNTLNNIYSLIDISTQDAQKSILSLSKLMRYLLYESEKGDTKMSHEIEFMENYIDLMKLRLSNKVDLAVSFPEKFNDFSIPPLLFIPFIENAFKHGVSYREKSFIHIYLDIDSNGIIFECNNSSNPPPIERSKEDSGIGLDNVQKRLMLLFPKNHQLKVEKTDKLFSIILKINIEPQKS